MRVRECLGDDHSVGTSWLGKVALDQRDTVEVRLAVIGDGQDHAAGRFAQPRDVEHGVALHTRFDARHAGNGDDALVKAVWRPDGRGEHVGEGIAVIIGGARVTQRPIGADADQKRHHARRRNKANGQGLRPQTPEIAPELFVERFHHDTSAGRMRSVFILVSTICPSAMNSTR